MANVEHKNILDADCHEPKHISSATTSDHGKVITPSAVSDGTSVLSKLSSQELSSREFIVSLYCSDITVSDSFYCVAPNPEGGTLQILEAFGVVIDNIPSGDGNITLTLKLGSNNLQDTAGSNADLLFIEDSGEGDVAWVDIDEDDANSISNAAAPTDSTALVATSGGNSTTGAIRAMVHFRCRVSD